MADYITGIAPLRMKFWIEYERMQAEKRIYTSDLQFENSECSGFSPSWNEDCDVLHWCATCEKKATERNPAAESTIKFQIRCWCDKAYTSIAARGGCLDELQWLVAARGVEHEKLEFHGATNGVWDGDEKTGFAKFREMFSGDK